MLHLSNILIYAEEEYGDVDDADTATDANANADYDVDADD